MDPALFRAVANAKNRAEYCLSDIADVAAATATSAMSERQNAVARVHDTVEDEIYLFKNLHSSAEDLERALSEAPTWGPFNKVQPCD